MTTHDAIVFIIGFAAGISAAIAGIVYLAYITGNSLRKGEREGEGSNL
ncbi:MAG: hypothetical protein HZB85_10145 [Deltaproteobacteria bacterium]|nr:hypothetical protein [Deltaproteobacteria bacterium]